MRDEDYVDLTIGERAIIDLMKEQGTPITRENYIRIAYGDNAPDPWGAEDEAELPAFLQRSGSSDE